MKKQHGFTLIEMIVTLILVGIMAVVAGMGIVAATKGFLFAKDNSANSQKANLALSRLNREFQELVTIPDMIPGISSIPVVTPTATSLSYQRFNNGVNTNYSVGLLGTEVKIKSSPVGGTSPVYTDNDADTLIGNVVASTGFTLTYFNGSDPWAGTTGTADIQKLSTIRVVLTLNQPSDGSTITFSTTVNPRNNNNTGGASASGGSGGTLPQGCFIATAAFGDNSHPIVLLLRDFRDRILLQYAAGRWFVNTYYRLSPPLAKIIEDRPIAMLVTRIALLPAIGIAYLLLYHPWWVFVVLFAIILLFCVRRLTGDNVRRLSTFQQHTILTSNRQGSVLIGLIITMVIMASLGAAMTSFISSASSSQIGSNFAQRAYFLAESGFRYAASEFLAADVAVNAAAKENMLMNLNGKSFILNGNNGSFSIIIYPFYYRTTANYVIGAGGSTPAIATEVPGTLDPLYNPAPTSGYLKIGNLFYQYNSTSYTAGSPNVTFNLTSPLTVAVDQYQTISLAALKSTATNSLPSTTIILDSNASSAFPLINGNFTIEGLTGANAGRIWTYTRRVGPTLFDIRALNDQTVNLNNITINSTTNYIVLAKFAKIRSTGIYAAGTNMVTQREILYNAPIGWVSAGAPSFGTPVTDTFDNLANFPSSINGQDTSVGNHAIASVDGSNAMDVTSVQYELFAGYWSARIFDWNAAGADLAQAWYAAGRTLSTDLQVKVRLQSNVPFMAGIGFKAQSNSGGTDVETYGVSFIRGHQSRVCFFVCWQAEDSGIPSALVPNGLYSGLPDGDRYSNPAIMLWKRQSGAFSVLAYKIFSTNDAFIFTNGVLSNWATILVRTSESYPLGFDQGGTTPFLYGDVVTVKRAGATINQFRVNSTPLVASGSWTGNDAAGTLPIANILYPTVNLQDGDVLYVGTTPRAVATGNYGTKSHYVRVYYGDTAAHGTPNAIANDDNRDLNVRIITPLTQTLKWPVDDISTWAAANDYFTLISGWNFVGNGANVVSLLGTEKEYNAVIMDNNLLSPSTTNILDHAGILLYTSGSQSSNLYFDDFGIRWEGNYGSGGGVGFLPPIQQ